MLEYINQYRLENFALVTCQILNNQPDNGEALYTQYIAYEIRARTRFTDDPYPIAYIFNYQNKQTNSNSNTCSNPNKMRILKSPLHQSPHSPTEPPPRARPEE